MGPNVNMGTEVQTEPLTSAKVTAKTLGMGLSAFYRMAKANIFPTYRVGVRRSGLRFSISEVKAALRQGPSNQNAD